MLKIIVDYTPNPTDDEFVREAMIAFNEKILGEREKPISIFLKNSAEKIHGGLLGGIDTESLYIDILWVTESLRKQGYGSQLIQAAEREAIKFGSKFSTTDTLDYQAEGFYLKHGYQRVGEIPNHVFGHSRIFLRKDLTKE